MKLAAVRAGPFALPFRQPPVTAHGRFATRRGVLLELRDADGHVGYGEAAPWPGFGAETFEASLSTLQGVEFLLRDADLAPGSWPEPVVARLRDAPAARGALDGALWDLAARRAGQTLARFLAAHHPVTAGPVLNEVSAGALLTAEDPAAVRDQAAAARAAGHRAAKLKLGAASLAQDVERARAARDGLGPDIALRGDANGIWTPARAAQALAALEAFGFEYIEQPLAAHDIEGLARLRRAGSLRIAADESVATGAGFEQLLDAQAADVIILKPTLVGGPGRALALAGRAVEAGCQVVFTHAFDSAVGARHALHCAAAWGDSGAVHGLAAGGLFERDFALPLEYRRGTLPVPAGAGLGMEIRGLVP